MSNLDNTNTPAPANLFKPSEIIGILRNHLATGQVNQRVVCLRGIYFKGSYVNQYYHTATDRLVDESTSDELSLSMPLNLRDDLENGNVITVHGILDRSITNKGLIQIVLKVTEVEKIKELAVSEDEIKRTELRRIKSEKGFKNVDSILESLLYQDKRPQIALVYAETSITNDDFEKGVQAARTHIDFKEYRVSFAKTKAFCQTLKQLDTMNYDVIAIIRGGGAGLEALDEVELLETLVNMNTALGTYFRDITDGVVQKRNNSRAALVKEVEGQFKKQIEDSNKKNQELTKQLEALQKQNKAQTEASNKKIEELTKAQKEHEKVVKAMTEQHKKATEEANKLHKTQNETLQKANTQLQEQLKTQGKTLTDLQEQTKKQQEEMNKSLGKMQEANNQLQKNLAAITTQNTESLKQLAQAKEHAKDLEHKLSEALNNKGGNSTIWMVIAIVAIIILIVSFFLR